VDLLTFLATCAGSLVAAFVAIKVARISKEVSVVGELNGSQHRAAQEERMSAEATILNALEELHSDVRDIAHRVGIVDGKVGYVHRELKEHIAVDQEVQAELLGRLPHPV